MLEQITGSTITSNCTSCSNQGLWGIIAILICLWGISVLFYAYERSEKIKITRRFTKWKYQKPL